MSNKEILRIQKKTAKAKRLLQRHENISASERNTPNLFVANGGLGNGVLREELERLFSNFGEVVAIVQKPLKPYAFVSMSDQHAAEEAFNSIHGRLLKCPEEVAVQGLRLYLLFLNTVPEYIPDYCTLPSGLELFKDFVTEEEEQSLLACIDWESSDDNLSEGARQCLKHRRVKHYGYEFLYGSNMVDVNKPLECAIPAECAKVIEALQSTGLIKYKPDQLTINEYQPGQGIPPHIDTHSAFEDGLCILSLGSEVVMEFDHSDNRHVALTLSARSLLVLTGESRYAWSHGITPRKSDVVVVPAAETHQPGLPSDETGKVKAVPTLRRRGVRTSFTFRKVLRRPCQCAYPEHCDSKGTAVDNTPTVDNARDLEAQYVHQVYEDIAGHFSATRFKPWPRVVEFVQRQPVGSIILDVGCGNGKYLDRFSQAYMVGCDRSSNLCAICEERNFPVFVADCLALPVRSCSVDIVLSIAVIHHLSTKERRLQALTEILRVLRPGGQALVYAWAFEQSLSGKSKYLKDSKVRKFGQSHSAKSQQGFREILKSEIVDSGKRRSVSDTPVDEHRSEDSDRPGRDGLCCHDGQQHQHTCQTDSVHTNEQPLPTALSPQGCDNNGHNSTDSQGLYKLPVHINRTHFQHQDLLVPWHLREHDSTTNMPVYHRYYHVFKEGELEDYCRSVGGVSVLDSYHDNGNWCVVVKKEG